MLRKWRLLLVTGSLFSLASSTFAATTLLKICDLSHRTDFVHGKASPTTERALQSQLPGYLLSLERSLSLTLKKKGSVDIYHMNDPTRPFQCGFWWLEGQDLVVQTFSAEKAPEKALRFKTQTEEGKVLIDGQPQNSELAWDLKWTDSAP